GPQLAVAVNAGGVTVGEFNLQGVIAERLGGAGAYFRFVHRKDTCRGWRVGHSGCLFFPPQVVAGRAGAFIAEESKIVMATVSIGPGDIQPGAGGDMHLHVSGFFAWVWCFRHVPAEDYSETCTVLARSEACTTRSPPSRCEDTATGLHPPTSPRVDMAI